MRFIFERLVSRLCLGTHDLAGSACRTSNGPRGRASGKRVPRQSLGTRVVFVIAALTLLTPKGFAQESQAAKATREKLKQVIGDFDAKEVGTKAFFEDVNREIEKSINFKIDGTSGISNNTKLTFKAKKITVEKLLNDLSDKYDFGWYVVSNPGNNKIDGWIIIRRSEKGKERGYEAGKEPK